jgi:hypothetical protein
LAFCKHLLVCDVFLGVEFLKEIQVHYDMNSEAKMLTKKLKMPTYSHGLVEQNCPSWRCGMNMLLWRRARNSQAWLFLLPIRQMVAQCNFLALGILFLDAIFFSFFSKMFFLIAFLFLQLEIEVLKLYYAIISNLSLVMKKVYDMTSLSSYIQ